MKVLFIVSGNHGAVSPVVKNQGDALMEAGVDVEYYLIKGKGIRGYLRNVCPLRKFVKSHHFDVIHAHFSLTAFLATLAGIRPLVVSLMGSDVRDAKWYTYVIRIFAYLGKWKAIIVKSKDMYNFLGVKSANILPNGVNLKHFLPMEKAECQKMLGWESNKKHILFPADPSRPDKDYPVAAKAFSMMDMNDIEVHYFIGVPHQQTPLWYNAADLVLLTSRVEGSPNAIKEAMACNRPIVVTKVGDVSERLEGVDYCFVAKTREPQEIAQLVQNALEKDIYTNGREKLEKDGITSEIIVNKLINIYHSVNI